MAQGYKELKIEKVDVRFEIIIDFPSTSFSIGPDG
jgi:hypothetical protein